MLWRVWFEFAKAPDFEVVLESERIEDAKFRAQQLAVDCGWTEMYRKCWAIPANLMRGSDEPRVC